MALLRMCILSAMHSTKIDATLVHADECGIRIKGTLHWLHCTVTATLTCLAPHAKRGARAFKALGLAPVIGKTTAGAGVFLSDQNRLLDNGIMRAAKSGQMTPQGQFIIEGTAKTGQLSAPYQTALTPHTPNADKLAPHPPILATPQRTIANRNRAQRSATCSSTS